MLQAPKVAAERHVPTGWIVATAVKQGVIQKPCMQSGDVRWRVSVNTVHASILAKSPLVAKIAGFA